MEKNPTFMMVPNDLLDEIVQLLKELKQSLPGFKPESQVFLGDWVPEPEAKRILGRKTTWFYNMRKSGELLGNKRGGQWWYHKNELLQFIEGKNMDG